MFSTDVKVGRGYTPSSPSLPGHNTLDPAVKAYWVERMDTNLKEFRIACSDLRQTQQVRRELNADIASLKLQQEEIEAQLQEINTAKQDNAAKRQENTAAIQENAAAIQENTAAIQENTAAIQENAAAIQENAIKKQENAARKQQLMEQLAANAANLNEIQELKQVVEDMLRTAEQLAVKAQAIFPSTEDDSDDDFDKIMANLDHRRAAKASEKAGAAAVLV